MIQNYSHKTADISEKISNFGRIEKEHIAEEGYLPRNE